MFKTFVPFLLVHTTILHPTYPPHLHPHPGGLYCISLGENFFFAKFFAGRVQKRLELPLYRFKLSLDCFHA